MDEISYAALQPKVAVVPVKKRIRAEIAGTIIADSTHAVVLLERGHHPVYYFPAKDVRADLLEPSPRTSHCPHKGDASYRSITIGGTRREDAVWSYEAPLEAVRIIAGRLAFYWDKVDRWLEEDEEIFGHPRSPFHRVDILPSSRRARVILGGETVAETRRGRFLFETGMRRRVYIPREDVAMRLLSPTSTRTICPYKGFASYWTARIGERSWEDVVWSYADPCPESLPIQGLLCFYDEKVDRIEIEER